MYTILRLEQEDIRTYIMILVDNSCSQYDFLTYDKNKSYFIDENFSYDSFITKENNTEKIRDMIKKIGLMIENIGLKSLMYNNITEFQGIRIESLHVPENYQFKYNEIYNLS